MNRVEGGFLLKVCVWASVAMMTSVACTSAVPDDRDDAGSVGDGDGDGSGDGDGDGDPGGDGDGDIVIEDLGDLGSIAVGDTVAHDGGPLNEQQGAHTLDIVEPLVLHAILTESDPRPTYLSLLSGGSLSQGVSNDDDDVAELWAGPLEPGPAELRIGTLAGDPLAHYELALTALPVPSCGDGAVAFPEVCDDGNDASGDGCDSQCAIEFLYSCDTSVAPSVCAERTDIMDLGTLAIGEGFSFSLADPAAVGDEWVWRFTMEGSTLEGGITSWEDVDATFYSWSGQFIESIDSPSSGIDLGGSVVLIVRALVPLESLEIDYTVVDF